MAYLRSQRERLAQSEQAVRQDMPDAAFDLRTAVRRIRAALRTYRPLVVDDQLVTELIDELCWRLGRAVSVVRDAQVARARLTVGLDELDDELLRGPVRALVSEHFAQVDAAANAALSEALDSPPWLAAPAGSSCSSMTRNSLCLPSALPRPNCWCTSGRRLGCWSRRCGRSDPSDDGLHAVRKTARHLRESALVARPVVGSPVKRFDHRLQKLLRMLGEHQDTVISRRVLAELLATAERAGHNGFTFALLYGQERARAEEVRNNLPRRWDRTWRPAYLGWLDGPGHRPLEALHPQMTASVPADRLPANP